jgi:hypothetical protein
MADPAAWSELARWSVTLCKKALPERLLRWTWSDKELLNAIQVVHFEQAPHFYVQTDRHLAELQYVGFNLFNLSPFKLAIVGLDLRISVDNEEWFTPRERLPTETPMGPYARSGFHVKQTLNERQAKRLREYPADSTQIRVQGHIIIKSVFGDLRKEIHADVNALISRDHRVPARLA